VHCTGRAAACFRLGFAKAPSLCLQLARKAKSLLRILGEKRFQLRIVDCICCFSEAFLSIFQGFNQIIDC